MSNQPHRVIFVCMGNICRSPTGEAVFRKYVEDAGLGDRFVIDSAGTIGYHAGEPADGRMSVAAARRGYDLTSISRKFVPRDFDRFDLVVAMDHDNYDDLVRLASNEAEEEKVVLFCDFVPGQEDGDVPDPYYGGPQGFETVLDLIESGCEAIVERCMNASQGQKNA